VIQYRVPVRNHTPQLLQYQFLDPSGQPIDLGPYASATLEVKLQGQAAVSVPALILSPASQGQVQVASYTFTAVGVWDAQFYAQDNTGNRLYGEPVQFRVVPNLEDLDLAQLPSY
jgi:hypothetical protein